MLRRTAHDACRSSSCRAIAAAGDVAGEHGRAADAGRLGGWTSSITQYQSAGNLARRCALRAQRPGGQAARLTMLRPHDAVRTPSVGTEPIAAGR